MSISFQLINPTVDIALFATILAVLSIAVQIKFLDWKKTRQMQRTVQAKNKEAMELLKKGDESSKKQAEELQSQAMKEMSEQFKNLPKQMIISLIIFLPPFLLIQQNYAHAGYLINIPFDIPILGAKWGWFKWYAICGFIVSIALNSILGKLEEKGKI